MRVFSPERAPSPTSGSPSAVAERRRYEARILIVEDNPVNRKVAAGILERCGCDVATAENGRIALEVLAQKSFDLVVHGRADAGDGRTRSDPAHSRGRAVASSAGDRNDGSCAEGRSRAMLAAGMNGYISKRSRRRTCVT